MTMWEAIELREIRIFFRLAEELHFGRTAERLSISQSRVSQTIRELETKLGGKLLDRTSRRVALTPFGERLVAELRGPSDDLTRVLARARQGPGRVEGRLVISLLTPLATGPYFADITDRFCTLYPDCAIVMNDEMSPKALDRLRDGSADLLISWIPVDAPDVNCGPILSQEPRVVVVARDHPLGAYESITLEDIAEYAVADMQWVFPREICDEFTPPFTPSGRPIRRIAHGMGISGLSTLIAQGAIVHPTVARYAMLLGDPQIVAIPLEGLAPIRSALLWRDAVANQRIEAFVETARAVLSGIVDRGMASGSTASSDAMIGTIPPRNRLGEATLRKWPAGNTLPLP